MHIMEIMNSVVTVIAMIEIVVRVVRAVRKALSRDKASGDSPELFDPQAVYGPFRFASC